MTIVRGFIVRLIRSPNQRAKLLSLWMGQFVPEVGTICQPALDQRASYGPNLSHDITARVVKEIRRGLHPAVDRK